jgi:hypothetical protein
MLKVVNLSKPLKTVGGLAARVLAFDVPVVAANADKSLTVVVSVEGNLIRYRSDGTHPSQPMYNLINPKVKKWKWFLMYYASDTRVESTPSHYTEADAKENFGSRLLGRCESTMIEEDA